ncbi:hypothetical protein MJD09_25320 [bacterium]|nr:hypothetical protein [bacterium]
MKSPMKVWTILSVTYAVIAACSSEQPPYDGAYLPEIGAARSQGTWQAHGVDVSLVRDREITLDTKGDGFIIDFFDAVYRRDHFYAIGTSIPEIVVYDSSGSYVQTIVVNPAPKGVCGFMDIEMTPDGNVFIKNVSASEILELDVTGSVQRVWTTKNPDGGEDVHFGPMGMQVVESPRGRYVFSEIFQWLDPKDFIQTPLIARFEENGQLTKQFAKHHPILEEYHLDAFQASNFVVVGTELFLIEFPLPNIRVYSFLGELKREFGEWGAHQRPLLAMPANLDGEKEWHRSLDYTHYHKIEAVSNIPDVEAPLIAISYMNPKPYSEAVNNQERRNRDHYIKGDHYLMLYTISGELLMNDITLPGSFLDVDEEGRLVLLLEDDPENRRIGLYRLRVGGKRPASLQVGDL